MKDDAPYKAPHAPGYVPNPHYSQEDWDDVSDNPEWTEEDFANAKPFAEAMPELAAALAKSKAAKAQGVKVPISIRLSRDVLDGFKAKGPGWQTMIDETLRKALAESDGAPPSPRAIRKPASRSGRARDVPV